MRDLDSLSAEEAFMSSLFFIAVVSGNRASELANLDRSTVVFNEEQGSVSLAVVPSFLYKNQTSKRTPPRIKFPSLPDDKHLCPAQAVKRSLACSNPANHQKLFLNPVTGSPLNSASVRFWMCKSINWLLPGAIPRAHDVRKNAFSMAWVCGFSEDEIMRQGFWNSSPVFFRRYFNNIANNAPFNFVAAGSISG